MGLDQEFSLPELGLRIGGRGAKPLSWSEAGPLGEDDIRRLSEPRESEAPPIKKLRERHHALARMLADGMAPREAAIVCGYSSSRISILQGDPAFSELIAHYREIRTERYFDGMQAMAELHLDTVEELRDRLEDDPESFTNGHLMELVKLTADRTGKGPSSSTTIDVKVGLSDRLNAARERVAADRARLMKDVTPKQTGDTE